MGHISDDAPGFSLGLANEELQQENDGQALSLTPRSLLHWKRFLQGALSWVLLTGLPLVSLGVGVAQLSCSEQLGYPCGFLGSLLPPLREIFL